VWRLRGCVRLDPVRRHRTAHRRPQTRRKEITTWGILLGVAAGFLTDAIVTAAGA
jgi:hypothetical protein